MAVTTGRSCKLTKCKCYERFCTIDRTCTKEMDGVVAYMPDHAGREAPGADSLTTNRRWHQMRVRGFGQ